MHRRIRNKQDILNSSNYERISFQVQKEEMLELRERVKVLKSSRKSVKDMDLDEICDMLDSESDPDSSHSIAKQLNPSMTLRIQTMRDYRRQALQGKIREKIGEKNNKVKQLLKFRVVDAMNPTKTAVVSWWSPWEELFDVVKKGKSFEILKSTAGAPGREINITAGSSTIVKPMKRRPTADASKFYRTDTKISEINKDFKPMNDEFDVACLVIRVDIEKTHDFVKVYVVDESCSGFLCINFWSSLADYAYEDVVIQGHAIHARNLQWRPSHASDKIPQAFVSSDCTMFTIHPADDAHKKALQRLKEMIVNSSSFIQKCCETIDKETHKECRQIYTNPLLKTPALRQNGPVLHRSAPAPPQNKPILKNSGPVLNRSGPAALQNKPDFSNKGFPTPTPNKPVFNNSGPVFNKIASNSRQSPYINKTPTTSKSETAKNVFAAAEKKLNLRPKKENQQNAPKIGQPRQQTPRVQQYKPTHRNSVRKN